MKNINDSSNPETLSPAKVMLDLESLIKRYLKDIEQLKADMKEQKHMFDDTFKNDIKFKEADDKVKELNRIKQGAKQNIIRTPAVEELDQKIKGMKDEMKDLEDGLNDYVREYQRVSGATTIEGDDGEIMEIVTSVKLVKKSKFRP